MEPTNKVAPDTYILPSHVPVPGFGVLPVNAFVIKAHQPVLVDAGLHADGDSFMKALEDVIEPDSIEWLWLTHPDQDHVGAVQTMLRRSPRMRVITTYLGLGIYSLFDQLPMDRVYFLNPGESIDVGDRTLTALRPPTFDNPSTTGLFDSRTRALFSSDSFGGVLEAPVADARDIPAEALFGGQVAWTTVDSPWLHNVNMTKFTAQLEVIRGMNPAIILSSHLPPAREMTDQMLKTLAAVPDADPFLGPNQAALEGMLAELTAVPA